LLEAKSGTHSEQLSADQLRLFVQELNAAESEASWPRPAKTTDQAFPTTGTLSGGFANMLQPTLAESGC
jgi:hypothetical protein